MRRDTENCKGCVPLPFENYFVNAVQLICVLNFRMTLLSTVFNNCGYRIGIPIELRHIIISYMVFTDETFAIALDIWKENNAKAELRYGNILSWSFLDDKRHIVACRTASLLNPDLQYLYQEIIDHAATVLVYSSYESIGEQAFLQELGDCDEQIKDLLTLKDRDIDRIPLFEKDPSLFDKDIIEGILRTASSLEWCFDIKDLRQKCISKLRLARNYNQLWSIIIEEVRFIQWFVDLYAPL